MKICRALVHDEKNIAKQDGLLPKIWIIEGPLFRNWPISDEKRYLSRSTRQPEGPALFLSLSATQTFHFP